MTISELIWRREKTDQQWVWPTDTTKKRITVSGKDTFVLPADIQAVEVLKGRAWLSFNGADVTLEQGGRMEFAAQRSSVVITSLQSTPVMLALYD